MKKIFRNMLLLFAAGASSLMVSCSDDDGLSASTDRQFMTMFITDYTRGKGDDYPYNCGLDAAYPHGNTIHLYWYGVKEEAGCAGYQIQMALQSKVANGPEAWAKIQGTSDLLVDTIVGPDVLDLVLKDLQYSTDYRFAIRALSTRVIDKFGAEIVRLWVASLEYREDIRISDQILSRLVDAYRRIRNTCRFILGNITDLDAASLLPLETLLPLDRFALDTAAQTHERIQNAYEAFEFHKVNAKNNRKSRRIRSSLLSNLSARQLLMQRRKVPNR